MSRPASAQAAQRTAPAPKAAVSMKTKQAGVNFSFGEPEAVLDRRELFDLFETVHNGRWYEPPVPFATLAKTYRMAPHHQSAVLLKRNQLVKHFVPSRWLSRAEFSRWALDWIMFGNGYLEDVPNMNGRTAMLKCSPAAFTRVGIKPGQFWFLRGLDRINARNAHEFELGRVHHLIEPDLLQEIYGMPEYLSGLHSGLLNEAATIFRRRYFKNGSHAGYILYVSEEGFTTADSDKVRQAMRDAKGPGNFRNLYLHIPKGKKDGVQVIPIGEATAKDEFLAIKDVTAQDLLVAHRTPPILVAMMPKNTGGFGNVLDAMDIFFENEIEPIQQRMLEVNDWLGLEAVRFTPRQQRAAKEPAPMH